MYHEHGVMYVTYALGNEKYDAIWLQQEIFNKILPTPEYTANSKRMSV